MCLKVFIYLFIFSHVGLDVRLDYDSINTILFFFSKKKWKLIALFVFFSQVKVENKVELLIGNF